MGFWKKLFGIGAAAGGTAAAVKVAQKVKENNPDGVGDVNADGKVDYKDYVEETKKAAGEVYEEVASVVGSMGADAIEKAKAMGEELTEKAKATGEDLKEMAEGFVNKEGAEGGDTPV